MNQLTEKEIQASVEYTWRIRQAKTYFWLWVGAMVLSVGIELFSYFSASDRFSVHATLFLFAVPFVIWTACFSGFILFYYRKARNFLKNYRNYPAYEVKLNRPGTSMLYRRAVYYEVTVCTGNHFVTAQTNAYFSSALFSQFDLQEYHDKQVLGLFDEENEKFYVIRPVR